jgi:hypothetical protein
MANDNDMIRRKDALAELDRHAKGTTTLSGQTFRTIQLGEAAAAIAALPADDRVAKLVEALRVIAQFKASTSVGQNVHSIWKMTDCACAALASWEAGK